MSAAGSSSAGVASTATNAASDSETLRRNRILSSKLYFDLPLSKVPLIYSPSYDISFLGIEKLHPFDSSKWGRICRFLIVDGVLDKKHIVEPLEATKEDLLVVHTESYLQSLKSSLNVSIIVEVPPVALLPSCLVQSKVLYPFRKQVGGSILAAKVAKERGWAINVGGGFHHCSGDKGGGFCVYADISLCIHYAFVRLNISRVMIIDLDAHQGNGHEKDFANDRQVYILDMYNPGIYPFDYEAKRYITQKVEVVSGTSTTEYLTKLDEALKVAGSMFEPELVVYNAGTDILDGDPLGRLKISPDGIISRDEKVFRFARGKNIPLVMLTSGGYMKSTARIIADSIVNLSNKGLIDTQASKGKENKNERDS
ncbi:Histone deacetylase [Bertholletia excelsa]